MEYLKGNFSEGFLFDIVEVKQTQERIAFDVYVTDDHAEYHLLFDEKGDLLEKDMEPLYAADPSREDPGEEEFNNDDH
jgi:hypothetical protein